MTDSKAIPHPFPIVKASLTLLVVVMASAATAYWVLTGLLNFESQGRPCIIGAFISLAIGISGFMPVWLMSKRSVHGSAYGFMVSILVRCVVGFIAVAWLRWGSEMADAQTTLMWVAGWYMLVLAVEVKLISTHVLAVTAPATSIPETT